VGLRLAQGPALAHTLREDWDEALLFRDLATLRADIPLFEDVAVLRWRGLAPAFAVWCEGVAAPELLARARALAAAR